MQKINVSTYWHGTGYRVLDFALLFVYFALGALERLAIDVLLAQARIATNHVDAGSETCAADRDCRAAGCESKTAAAAAASHDQKAKVALLLSRVSALH